MKSSQNTNNDLQRLHALAKLMDSQFVIPGTNISFGLDPLIGLIPGFGDFAGFAVAAYMMIVLTRNGASGFLLARMTLNILIDALVGSVPLLGDLFDFGFKANKRNLKLMHQHYVEGRHKGSAWKLVIPLLLILLFALIGIVWISYRLFNWLINVL